MLRNEDKKNNERLSVYTTKGAKMRKCLYLEIANKRAADSPLVDEASRSELGFFYHSMR